MPEFDIDCEEILFFKVGDEYLFSHYFERQDIFEELSEYYNDKAYRFEVPATEVDEVKEFLDDNYYNPVIIEDLAPYCVIKEQYSKHAEILRNSVVKWERDGQMFFLMKDDLSVKEARERGAHPISETDYVVGL